MSDPSMRRRIRAHSLVHDPDVMGFVLDAPVCAGRAARFDGPGRAPLARALFALSGVSRVEVGGATIWVRKTANAEWKTLKPAIAAAIRAVLDSPDPPLGPEDETAVRTGADTDADADAALLREVAALLERRINPAVAAHGGRISAERVEGGAVFLRMSGGCQGCAASSATLRQGVERMLRAELPEIREIVDVTDHAAGDAPFYGAAAGPTPVLRRAVPEGAIGWEDGRIAVDPDYLAPKLGLTPQALREGLGRGEVTGVTEAGEGADGGNTRIIVRTATRAWAAEVLADGAAFEIPPPRGSGAAAARETSLAGRVRAHLSGLGPDERPVAYGALARALGLWAPGSVRRITRALELTMQEDAAAGRPFIAARAVGRNRDGLPGKGFFDQARALSRGPDNGESERQFVARETLRLDQALASGAEAPAGARASGS